MKTIVLATHNRDKIRELKAAFAGYRVRLMTTDDFPGMPETEEDRDTLRGNALKKAEAIRDYTGLPALADDTGLEVDALNGAPGVYSSRFAGENASYRDNVEKLIFEMREIPEEQRGARFRTVMVYAGDGQIFVSEGEVFGRILKKAYGSGGFGYDPIFYYPPFDKTFSEISVEDKNKISHRGLALLRMTEILQKNAILEEV